MTTSPRFRLVGTLSALLCFMLSVVNVARAETATFAVAVGNNHSLTGRRPDLHYADDDAAKYFEILQTIAPDQVRLLSSLTRRSRARAVFGSTRQH